MFLNVSCVIYTNDGLPYLTLSEAKERRRIFWYTDLYSVSSTELLSLITIEILSPVLGEGEQSTMTINYSTISVSKVYSINLCTFIKLLGNKAWDDEGQKRNGTEESIGNGKFVEQISHQIRFAGLHIRRSHAIHALKSMYTDPVIKRS